VTHIHKGQKGDQTENGPKRGGSWGTVRSGGVVERPFKTDERNVLEDVKKNQKTAGWTGQYRGGVEHTGDANDKAGGGRSFKTNRTA